MSSKSDAMCMAINDFQDGDQAKFFESRTIRCGVRSIVPINFCVQILFKFWRYLSKIWRVSDFQMAVVRHVGYL